VYSIGNNQDTASLESFSAKGRSVGFHHVSIAGKKPAESVVAPAKRMEVVVGFIQKNNRAFANAVSRLGNGVAKCAIRHLLSPQQNSLHANDKRQ
jgi:hypothetical protein